MRLTTLTSTLRVLTALAWCFAVYALTPWGENVPAEASMLALAVAVVGSIAAVTKHCSRPVDEVYLAGKDAGRRELLLEQAGERVVRLDERRLTLVARSDA